MVVSQEQYRVFDSVVLKCFFYLGIKYIHILSGNEEKLNDIYFYFQM